MTFKAVQALILAGDLSDEGYLWPMEKYLRDIGRYRWGWSENILGMSRFYEREGGFRRALRNLARDQTLLVVYSGPGEENGWPVEFSSAIFSYEELAQLLKNCAGRVLLVNSAPFSSFLLTHLAENKVDHTRIGVICGFHKDDTMRDGRYEKDWKLPSFLKEVVSYWERGQYYFPYNSIQRLLWIEDKSNHLPPKSITVADDFGGYLYRHTVYPFIGDSKILQPLREGVALDYLFFPRVMLC